MKLVTLLSLLFALPLLADDFDSDGVKIHYIDEGKGDPVVLVHGFASSIKLNWELPGVVALLSKSYRVIALDCRGFGQSDKPEGGEENYGVKMVDDVVRLMDHLEVKKAHVVGYSMGGCIVMKLIASHPDRVISAVLGGWGWLKKGGVLGKAFEMIPERSGAMPEGCFQSLGTMGLTEEEVKGIKVQVSMIVGDRDPCRLMYVKPLSEARPDFPVTEIAGAGHISAITKPEFKDDVKAALDKQAGGK